MTASLMDAERNNVTIKFPAAAVSLQLLLSLRCSSQPNMHNHAARPKSLARNPIAAGAGSASRSA